VTIQFTPHLIPVNRGILTTLYLTPTTGRARLESRRVRGSGRGLLSRAYSQEPFVRLLRDRALPDTKNVVGTNVLELAWRADPRTGRLILVSAEDNVVKGAGGQAVQSANILCGFPETAGLM
jgi:N-acetyl-gamma-glutamyl-phosphate reductase